MKKINLRDLKPGMLTATPVYSKQRQVLLPEHTFLSTQHIARLAFYNVEDVFVFSEEELTTRILDSAEEDTITPSYSQKLKNSPEFQEFKKSYQDKITFVTGALNDIIKSNREINQKELLADVSMLFKQNTTSLSVFNMLHNMHEIDDSTYAHSVNVSIIARLLGKWLNFSPEDLDLLTLGGLLHDIGKCMIDPAIIQKPGKLTDDEYKQIKEHPIRGCEVLRNQKLDPHVKCCVLMHHERADGTGYPLGRKGEETDRFAQVVAIADVYDAMTANRCYRNGLCPYEVIATFEKDGFQVYNPQYILTFLEHIADAYVSHDVMLSDGSLGVVVLVNRQQLSRPVVRITDGSFIDLSQRRDLFIEKIL